MRRLAAAAVAGAVLSVMAPSASAQADTGFEDTQSCVTEQEVNSMPAKSKAGIEQHFDTSGWLVYGDGLFKIKHYEFCGRPSGWVAVSYVLTKRGWRYRAAITMYECKTRDQNLDGTWGEWVPCDNTQPTDIEFYAMRPVVVKKLVLP